MGCVESNEAVSDVDERPGQGPKAETPPPEEKGKKKKKDSIRKKSTGQKKALEVETRGLKARSESTRITVIWRRWSTFSSARNSFKSNKSLEGEAAGPSGKLAQSAELSSSSA
ncbi:uncharacterized protein PHA67_000913 [Liasis olivaceus]